MRKSMKIVSIVLALAMLFSFSVPTYAMSKKNVKAHKALNIQLRKDKKRYCDNIRTKLKYAYTDIDGDGVDELITEPGYGVVTQIVYDYKKGHVTRSAVTSQGGFDKFYRKNRVIASKNTGHMDTYYDRYLKFNKNSNKYKVVAYAEKSYGVRNNKYQHLRTYYYVNDKRTNKSTYQAYVKKLVSNDKGIKFKKLKWKKY